MECYIGFDSAWTDSSKSPGAVCAVTFEDGEQVTFLEPKLTTFKQALDFIREASSKSRYTLIAIDQPTIVPNLTGMRPVERLASSLISWMGGGVQPANRSKRGMFCDKAPLWDFLGQLGAIQDLQQSRDSTGGCYVIEVFPALALASFGTQFFERLGQPKYNPANKKKFLSEDWGRLAEAASAEAHELGCAALERWLHDFRAGEGRCKADQDKLDSLLCLLTALRWRKYPETCLVLGNQLDGYMVVPASDGVREYLNAKAIKLGVEVRSGSRN